MTSNFRRVSAIAFMLSAGAYAGPIAGSPLIERATTTTSTLPSILTYGGNLNLQFTNLTASVQNLSGNIQSLVKGQAGSATVSLNRSFETFFNDRLMH
jgi:hypothetical protein